MGKVIGIDFGTTYSRAAVVEHGRPVVLPNARGSRSTPSVVAFAEDGERLVGETAARQAATNPQNTIFSVKRLIGRGYEDAASDGPVVEGPNGDAWLEIGERAYSPTEIAATVLQEMRRAAEAYLGEKVTETVVSVPAYFSAAQRQAVKDAGKIAGLEVRRIMHDATAASLAYGLDRKTDEKIAVYDLGGGTFEVSVLELGDGVFEVKAVNGDTRLGGDDFDERVVAWLAEAFQQEEGINLQEDPAALQRLREAAQTAKCALSSSTQTDVSLPFISADKHLNATLRRWQLEQLVEDLIDRTVEPCRQALSDAGMSPGRIDEVVLVGGQTRMPKVQDAVRSLFGRDPHRPVNPEEAVAIGAAIHGAVLSGEITRVLVLDVTPVSLGIAVRGGRMSRLIERNTTVPTKVARVFPTGADNQTAMEIRVLQGESERAADNTVVSRLRLEGIPPAPKGAVQVEVTFDIDANGILNVSAQDKETGKQQSVRIEASGGLSEEEIDRLVREAKSREVEDRRRLEEAEMRNRVDRQVHRREQALGEMADMDADARARIQAALDRVRAALEGSDREEIEAAAEALEQIWQEAC